MKTDTGKRKEWLIKAEAATVAERRGTANAIDRGKVAVTMQSTQKGIRRRKKEKMSGKGFVAI